MMIYIIAAPCVGIKDGSCAKVCPTDCIHEGEDQYYVEPGACIGCNACAAICPTGAIFEDDEVPEPWRDYIERNARYFQGGVVSATSGRTIHHVRLWHE